MRILLTNDDGIYAPGIRALHDELCQFAEVTMVAPASEQSGVGHSITFMNPLLVGEIMEAGEFVGYAVEGKPADCVKLGIVKLLREPPDLIVSGINAGLNAGINVLYSGTVAAAIEGAFFGIPSIAVSLELPMAGHFPKAAQYAVKVIKKLLEYNPQPGDLFNVNIPTLASREPRGIRCADQALEVYRETYEERVDPRGRRYYWLLPDPLVPGDSSDSDLAALANGYISVTPLHFDLTARTRLEKIKSWKLTLD